MVVVASVRVTHDVRVGPVKRITRVVKIPRSEVRPCKERVTGLPLSLVSRGGVTGDELVLIASVSSAGAKVKGAAISINLSLKLGGVKGGTIATLERPSLNPYFKVGNNTTNNKCTRILPVRGVGLRFANSFRTVASTGGVVSTLLSGCVCRRRRSNFNLGRVL